jgi:glutamate N-acetyltransferase/amino-acid acetyltransferase
MREINGGVCAPKGFRAGGVRCGIKASSAKRDLALILADTPCTAAAVFTTNRVKAASVLVSREHLAHGICRAVIANSGNANACTGAEGLAAARRMAVLAGAAFGFPPEQAAVASTGVIGVPLPIAAVEKGMGALAASLSADAAGYEAALEAIMTTDTRKKGSAVETDIGGAAVRLGGMVKGSGMIHPNMATMLGFITTDAAIRNGLKLAHISEETIKNLIPEMPDTAALHNPVDVIGDATSQRYQAAMKHVLADPGVDSAIVILTPQAMTDIPEIAKIIPPTAQSSGKPVVASFMGMVDVLPGVKFL